MELARIKKTPVLPRRDADAHKGQFGSVLVIAGSRGMSGAAALSGAAAMRSGAGLVRIASPEEVAPIVATFEPCYMTYPLGQDDRGLIDFERSVEDLSRLIATADVIVVGPGLGQSLELQKMIAWLINTAQQPLVIDADGLNNLIGQVELFQSLQTPTVITPHPGEFARLTGSTNPEVQANRVQAASDFAARFDQLIVVLKGSRTLITDGKQLFENQTGNPGMATAGSGDVLAGIIGALIGQKLRPFDAGVLGVHVHGLAGDIAREEFGEVSLIASDLIDQLPDAFEVLRNSG